jgi:hypothetical protein
VTCHLDSQEKKGKFHGHLGSRNNIVHRVCQKLPAGSVNGNATVRCPTEEEGVEWDVSTNYLLFDGL